MMMNGKRAYAHYADAADEHGREIGDWDTLDEVLDRPIWDGAAERIVIEVREEALAEVLDAFRRRGVNTRIIDAVALELAPSVVR